MLHRHVSMFFTYLLGMAYAVAGQTFAWKHFLSPYLWRWAEGHGCTVKLYCIAPANSLCLDVRTLPAISYATEDKQSTPCASRPYRVCHAHIFPQAYISVCIKEVLNFIESDNTFRSFATSYGRQPARRQAIREKQHSHHTRTIP